MRATSEHPNVLPLAIRQLLSECHHPVVPICTQFADEQPVAAAVFWQFAWELKTFAFGPISQ